MFKIVSIFALLFIVAVSFKAQSQAVASKPDSSLNKTTIRGFPVAFYSPDTKLGVGALGIVFFNFKKDSIGARKSSINIGGAYTTLNQVLLYTPFQIFVNNSKYWFYGELGYYKYIFNYFGVGNNTPNDYIEKYDARFPRIRINALRKVNNSLYVGVRYVYDNFSLSNYRSDGELIKNRITGSTGGRVSGLGLISVFDSRNKLFYPTKGALIEAIAYYESPATGSDFSYNRLSIDAAKYLAISNKQVLAFNAVIVNSNGDVPFHQMATLGGGKRQRGYFDGKFRDRNLLLLQAEYRATIYKRFGAVAFGGLGQVSSQLSEAADAPIRYNFGAGLRYVLDTKQKLNIRIDYGLGAQSSGFYLTLGEAF
jgi:hypothetical protein